LVPSSGALSSGSGGGAGAGSVLLASAGFPPATGGSMLSAVGSFGCRLPDYPACLL
jgi:hypothetical protein